MLTFWLKASIFYLYPNQIRITEVRGWEKEDYEETKIICDAPQPQFIFTNCNKLGFLFV